MKILLLCDRASGLYREPLRELLSNAGHEVDLAVLNREKLTPCLGCFGCWLKTPGMCVMTGDEANDIARREMRSGAVILLSEIAFGGFGADIKSFLDRSIANILPFFEIHEGEMHHERRYERFPLWIAVGYGDAPQEERQTFVALAERNAINMRPPWHASVTLTGDSDLPEAGRAILRTLEGRI